MSITATNRVTWKSIVVADHAYVSFGYTSNQDIRVVPRAKGVKIWSTTELGGGFLNITVHCIVAKENRTLLESFFSTMDTTFTLGTAGSLVITGSGTTITLSNCYLESFDQEDSDFKANTYTMKFVKSL